MSKWLEPLKRIIDEETGDLRKMAEAVGANATLFYVGQDLSKCDLRGQDLRGLDLSRTNLHSDQMDESTLIDEQFDPRFEFKDEYINIRLSDDLFALTLAYADESNYSYRAWAIKRLIEFGTTVIGRKDNREIPFIRTNKKFADLLRAKKGHSIDLHVQVYPYLQRAVHAWSVSQGRKVDRDSYAEILLAGLVHVKMPRIAQKDYSGIDPFALFKNTQHYLTQVSRGHIR